MLLEFLRYFPNCDKKNILSFSYVAVLVLIQVFMVSKNFFGAVSDRTLSCEDQVSKMIFADKIMLKVFTDAILIAILKSN